MRTNLLESEVRSFHFQNEVFCVLILATSFRDGAVLDLVRRDKGRGGGAYLVSKFVVAHGDVGLTKLFGHVLLVSFEILRI